MLLALYSFWILDRHSHNDDIFIVYIDTVNKK